MNPNLLNLSRRMTNEAKARVNQKLKEWHKALCLVSVAAMDSPVEIIGFKDNLELWDRVCKQVTTADYQTLIEIENHADGGKQIVQKAEGQMLAILEAAKDEVQDLEQRRTKAEQSILQEAYFIETERKSSPNKVSLAFYFFGEMVSLTVALLVGSSIGAVILAVVMMLIFGLASSSAWTTSFLVSFSIGVWFFAEQSTGAYKGHTERLTSANERREQQLNNLNKKKADKADIDHDAVQLQQKIHKAQQVLAKLA